MANIYDMVDSWTDSGTIYTAIKMDTTDTASAASSLLMDLKVNGITQFKVRKNGFTTINSAIQAGTASSDYIAVGASDAGAFLNQMGNGFIDAVGSTARWGMGANSTTIDAVLARDSADVISQRRTTTAQEMRWYFTYTNSSNNEYAFINPTSSGVNFGYHKNGTGTFRSIRFYTSSLARWIIDTSGNWVAATDASYDIGQAGATRPRHSFISGTYTGGLISLAAGTISSNQPNIFLQTWNAAGVTFTGFKVNISDSASAAASLLLDLQIAASSKFSVSKAGVVTAASFIQGKLQTNTAATVGTVTCDKLLTLYDSAGTAYRVPCTI
jgi:hypothetical protein